MASLLLLEHKLRKAILAGDEVQIRSLRKQIDAERKRRGKQKRRGL